MRYEQDDRAKVALMQELFTLQLRLQGDGEKHPNVQQQANGEYAGHQTDDHRAAVAVFLLKFFPFGGGKWEMPNRCCAAVIGHDLALPFYSRLQRRVRCRHVVAVIL